MGGWQEGKGQVVVVPGVARAPGRTWGDLLRNQSGRLVRYGMLADPQSVCP